MREKRDAPRRRSRDDPRSVGRISRNPMDALASPHGSVAATVARVREQLNAMRAITVALADNVDIDTLLTKATPDISRLMHARCTVVFLFDVASQTLVSKLVEGESLRPVSVKLKQGVAGLVAYTRKPLLIADAAKEPRFDAAIDATPGIHVRTVASVPVVEKSGQLLGVVQVLNHRGCPFDDNDLKLLVAIASQLAYAVEHARFAERILEQNRELDAARKRAERRRAELELLYELEQETAAAVDLDDLVDSSVARICARLHSEVGIVFLEDAGNGRSYQRRIHIPDTEKPAASDICGTSTAPEQGIAGWVAQNGQPALVNHPDTDSRYRGDDGTPGGAVRATLAVPLVWNQHVIGAVEVQNPRPRVGGVACYDEEDLMLLTVAAGQLVRAINLEIERQARNETERLAVIGRMLAGVAHDLRNPMTVIAGYAQLLASATAQGDRQRGSQCIAREISEMTGMITDLLAFARGDSELHPMPVQLAGLAQDIERNLRLHATVRDVALCIIASSGTVYVDLSRVKRIVYNLARNALEAVVRQGHVDISLSLDDDALLIEVRDDGPGVPEVLSQRLFEPFTTAGKEQGTGLGLSIVKRFVDDHGGTITISSGEGHGTKVNVRLPAASPAGYNQHRD